MVRGTFFLVVLATIGFMVWGGARDDQSLVCALLIPCPGEVFIGTWSDFLVEMCWWVLMPIVPLVVVGILCLRCRPAR